MFTRLKAVSEIYDKSNAQALNYLSVSVYKLLLIVNFGKPKIDFKRIIK
ncbi:MAG: GxxExxY protein [Prolixibacteraceae bacterium]|nr:GxxExxY protein [Prolixibacteraceae bacterium]